MTDQFITIQQCISVYKLSPQFVDELENAGLIEIILRDGKRVIAVSQLLHFEQYIRWSEELDINMPGIEAIHDLLEKMRAIQVENERLNNEIQFYKSLYSGEFDDFI